MYRIMTVFVVLSEQQTVESWLGWMGSRINIHLLKAEIIKVCLIVLIIILNWSFIVWDLTADLNYISLICDKSVTTQNFGIFSYW